MRDFEYWMDDGKPCGPIRGQLNRILDVRWAKLREDAERKAPGTGILVGRPTKAGLCVSVFDADQAQPGHPGHDRLYFMGMAVAIVQVGIAVVPMAVWGDWAPLFITVTGIVLAFATARLPQWAREKWACRRGCSKSVVLTKGNGAQHAILVIGTGLGLDLEDLASGIVDMDMDTSQGWVTQITMIVLAVFWIVLLIIAAGTQQNTWFLLAIGGIGIAENIFVAGAQRRPEAFGVPLKFREVIAETSVMETLFSVEKAYPRAGQAMLDTFFPGKLRPKEVERWEELGQLADGLDQSRKKAMAAK